MISFITNHLSMILFALVVFTSFFFITNTVMNYYEQEKVIKECRAITSLVMLLHGLPENASVTYEASVNAELSLTNEEVVVSREGFSHAQEHFSEVKPTSLELIEGESITLKEEDGLVVVE